jgi:hypothetical protein
MTMPANGTSFNRAWRFFRAGGFDQVRLENGADLMALDQLDQKLWVALACPVNGLEFDVKTLGLIDTDKDGRVRAPELIGAVKWAGGLLKNPGDLLKGAPTLPLAAINDTTPEGQAVLNAARSILANLGKNDVAVISVEDTTDTSRIFAQTQFNGDGIITADGTADDTTKAVITDIIACLGAETDRSGKPGVSQAKVDRFFAETEAYAQWRQAARSNAAILPLGDATAAAMAALEAVQAKVNDYFTRSRLAAFDPRAVNALNREEKEYLGLAAKDLTLTHADIAGFPLARVEANRPLPLLDGVNPAWAGALATFHEAVVKPLLNDRREITEADWAALLTKFAPYQAWRAGKPATSVDKLGPARVAELLASGAKENLAALIARDKAEEANVNAIATVDQLVRYHRDLARLLRNFVSFQDFYSRKEKAIFQAGTLFLDQRSCELCLKVTDAARHAAMAGLAGAYLAYVDCVRAATGEKLSIVAVFSQGDDENLMVGRNGIFYDRQGRDYDATITKIVANPISLRQAFWSPYKKLVRFIEEQISKRAAAEDADAATSLANVATITVNADKTKKIDVGTVAALGVAFGSIGTFVGLIFAKVLDVVQMGPLAIVGALLGAMAMISGPSLILAFIKLRKRNLGPILDANGWAVNAKAKINVPFGTSLTAIATLPPGSQRDLVDPFAEKKSPWPKIIAVAVFLYLVYSLLNSMGYIAEWTNGRLGTPKTTLVSKDKSKDTKPPADTSGTNAPAAK